MLQKEAPVAQARQLVGQADVFQRLIGLFQFQVFFHQLRLRDTQGFQGGRDLAVGVRVVQSDRAVSAQRAKNQALALAVGVRRQRLHRHRADHALAHQQRRKQLGPDGRCSRFASLALDCDLAPLAHAARRVVGLAGERQTRTFLALAGVNAVGAGERIAVGLDHENRQVGAIEQAMHVAVERAENGGRFEVGGDLLADGDQVFERGAGLPQHLGAQCFGGGQPALMPGLGARQLGLVLHFDGGGAIGRLLHMRSVARGASAQRHFISARMVAHAGVFAGHGVEQVGRHAVAVDGRGNRHRLAQEVQRGVRAKHRLGRGQLVPRVNQRQHGQRGDLVVGVGMLARQRQGGIGLGQRSLRTVQAGQGMRLSTLRAAPKSSIVKRLAPLFELMKAVQRAFVIGAVERQVAVILEGDRVCPRLRHWRQRDQCLFQ